MTAALEPDRCRRGHVCIDRVPFTLDDGTRTWAGALLAAPGLCSTCTRHIGSAINQLAGDVDELSDLLPPTGEQHWRDPDLPAAPRVKLYAPLPLREHILSLIELIDQETTFWATSVARATGLTETGDWSTLAAQRSRRYPRVHNACRLLFHRLPHLIGLPMQEHPARSLGSRRADGHDPDTTTVYGDDYWTHRDGIDGALLLLKLHRGAEHHTGRAPADTLPLPCPNCRRPALVRLHSTGRVDCRCCGDPGSDGERFTDQDYDAHLYGLGHYYGLDQPRAIRPSRRSTSMPEPAPPEGAQMVRPLDNIVHALTLTPENLEVARDWAGAVLMVDREKRPPRRWLQVPGVLRIAEPGDVLVRYPASERTPATFRVLSTGDYTTGFEAAQ